MTGRRVSKPVTKQDVRDAVIEGVRLIFEDPLRVRITKGQRRALEARRRVERLRG